MTIFKVLTKSNDKILLNLGKSLGKEKSFSGSKDEEDLFLNLFNLDWLALHSIYYTEAKPLVRHLNILH